MRLGLVLQPARVVHHAAGIVTRRRNPIDRTHDVRLSMFDEECAILTIQSKVFVTGIGRMFPIHLTGKHPQLITDKCRWQAFRNPRAAGDGQRSILPARRAQSAVPRSRQAQRRAGVDVHQHWLRLVGFDGDGVTFPERVGDAVRYFATNSSAGSPSELRSISM